MLARTLDVIVAAPMWNFVKLCDNCSLKINFVTTSAETKLFKRLHKKCLVGFHDWGTERLASAQDIYFTVNPGFCFHMWNWWHIWISEQVLKVLGKLDELKYPEYNLGYTWTAKLNILFGCTCEASKMLLFWMFVK